MLGRALELQGPVAFSDQPRKLSTSLKTRPIPATTSRAPNAMTDCDVCNSGPADHLITLRESAATIDPGDAQRLAVLEELQVCADCWPGIRILYVPPSGLKPRIDLSSIFQVLKRVRR